MREEEQEGMKAGKREAGKLISRAAALLFPALLLFCCPALAQTDPSTTLEQLNDSDHAVREAATRRLLRDETLALDALRELYGRAESPEQRHRLIDVLRHHAIRL